MAKESPTQRTLKFLRAGGWTAAITERWNPFAKLRQDLFGFIDVIAIREAQIGDTGCLAVQTTTGAHHAERKTKIIALPAAKTWILAGNRIWVLSWTKMGKGKLKKWEPRIEALTIGDFEEVGAA